MATSFAEATQKLLGGKKLSWEKFGEHKSGSIVLDTAAQRRIFSFLLTQDPSKLAPGHEDLFNGLILAWNEVDADPARTAIATVNEAAGDVWRLDRLEASGFGGLSQCGGTTFNLWVNGANWCLEGQNGSGKTSLTSSILWALTGKRIREQDGPVDEQGLRSPVTNSEGGKIGDWPSFASYPTKTQDLAKTAEVWVRLTFTNGKGELATAYRRMICPSTAAATFEVAIDPRLQTAPELIEIGLTMPARISRIGFGDRSQSLYDAVKMLTGLDLLSDIADCCSQITHGGRKFLRYGKDNGIDGFAKIFNEDMAKAEVKSKELAFALPDDRAIGDADVVQALRTYGANASTAAGSHLATLKADIPPIINTATTEGRLTVRNAASSARAIAHQPISEIPIFEVWTALKEAKDREPFQSLSVEIESVREKLARALIWHERQMLDAKFRLKALAAQSYIPPHEHLGISDCPLCTAALDTDARQLLAVELTELQNDAEEAERKIEDVCRSLEEDLLRHLSTGLNKHRDVLSAMNPKESYESFIQQRFCDEAPFKNILTGVASRLKAICIQQISSLPSFSYPDYVSDSEKPVSVLKLKRSIHNLERLVALVTWWSSNRIHFIDAWKSFIGVKQVDGSFSPTSVESELIVLEQALANAEPLDELSKLLMSAADAAESWIVIQEEQNLREAISKSLETMKGLRVLVGAETARSIATLSERMRGILDRIHLIERLNYEQASLGKKAVNVAGRFEPGMQFDASLVANTSWLRAILWAFVFALREETIEGLGANPFPLMLLDDPQTTFDPRNKRKWAQEIARLANINPEQKEGIQLLLTTHERQFFQCMVDHEQLVGEKGMIGGVNRACGVATIVNGGCLDRAWNAAKDAQNDALARDYIADVRIYCEDLLKFMLRGEGPHISLQSLDGLKKELGRLHDAHTRPFDRKVFTELRNILASGGGRSIKLINESHHKDDESIGLAEAKDVKDFWEKTLRKQIHEAFSVYDKFESFSGEPRSFPWEKNIIAFPSGHKAEVKALNIQQTGIAAAAKTDGQAGDGVVTVEEWEAGQPIILPNHEVYQLAAGTLDPVAGIGDLLIVCNHAKVNPRNLVIVVFGESLLARRYNQLDDHPDIVVLTGQSVDPMALPEPIIVSHQTAEIRKVVGTIFTSRLLPPPALDPKREFIELLDAKILHQTLDGTRLFQVKGRSAEPIALEGQFLITRETTKTLEDVKALDGRPVVAFDEDGTRYFKRLRCTKQIVILESLNPDGTTASEILSLDGSLGFPKLTHALEVIGVLFELPS
jgi:hypothetical protein